MATAPLHLQPQTVIQFPTCRAIKTATAPRGLATVVQLHAPAPEVEITRTPELALFLGLYANIGLEQQAATRRTLEALAYGGDPSAVAAFNLLSGSQ